jgi:cytochrome c551/c552
MEYLLTFKGKRGHSLEYELLFDGDAEIEKQHLMGLIDTDKLKKHEYDNRKLGLKSQKSVSSCSQVAPELVPSWSDKSKKNTEKNSVQIDLVEEIEKIAPPMNNVDQSYRTHIPLAASSAMPRALEV